MDKFGYYLVGNRKTYSKLEAFEWAGYDVNKIKWNFNDEVFSTFDWTKEPQQDINYLYDERAKQLRHEYDYIVLFYSSGYDSHNILKTFIDNNLHIDEIITMFPGKNIYSEMTYEHQNFTVKKLDRYSDKLLKTKITKIEYASSVIDLIQKTDIDDILYGMNGRYTPNHMMREKIHQLDDNIKKMLNKEKKVCYIYGIDKPIVQFDMFEKKYFSVFRDSIVANITPPKIQASKNDEIFCELFYWNTCSVDMLIKQSHMVKKFFMDAVQKKKPYIKKMMKIYDGKIEVENKNEMINLLLYPRCVSDIDLQYYDKNVYHNIIENLYLSEKEKKIKEQYPLIGYRDTWLHMSNNFSAHKMKILMDYLKTKENFLQNKKRFDLPKSFITKYRLS